MKRPNPFSFNRLRFSFIALTRTCILIILLCAASMLTGEAHQKSPEPKLRHRQSSVQQPVGQQPSVQQSIGQQPTIEQPPAPATAAIASPTQTAVANAAAAAQSDDRYLVGPGDVLDIRVYNRPQYSRDAVRVDGRGMIRMPLVDSEIQAACRTESELASEIVTRYRRILRNPYVDVFVKEYQSRPVAVIGAVNKPGRFQLQRRVRLLELLSFAGGQSERAGGRVQIARTAGAEACELPTVTDSDENALNGLISYNLNDTIRGDDKSNPYVRPGDTISIPEAEQAFVVGNVVKPSSIPLREPVTVSRAIAMAGGTLPDTKTDKVRIIRQLPGGSTKTEIFINLKAIDQRQAEDVALQAGDIVDVPTSSGKRFLRGLAGAIAPAVSQLPVNIIR